jgi:hypothetical protein
MNSGIFLFASSGGSSGSIEVSGDAVVVEHQIDGLSHRSRPCLANRCYTVSIMVGCSV